LVEVPLLLASERPEPVPFSRLTLTAQLEVLAHPAEQSWSVCAPLNPQLPGWKRRCERGELAATRWPARADHWLSGPAYARQFGEFVRKRFSDRTDETTGGHVQQEFIRERLKSGNLFPLLWSKES
jgi:hypothetical protein